MAHPIAQQGQPTLHQEDADERGNNADQGCRDEGSLHEVVTEESHVTWLRDQEMNHHRRA